MSDGYTNIRTTFIWKKCFLSFYKVQPEMMCESARTKLGTEYQLTCKASMNPKFTEAVWSWGDDMLTEIDAHTEDGNKHFMYSVSALYCLF